MNRITAYIMRSRFYRILNRIFGSAAYLEHTRRVNEQLVKTFRRILAETIYPKDEITVSQEIKNESQER